MWRKRIAKQSRCPCRTNLLCYRRKAHCDLWIVSPDINHIFALSSLSVWVNSKKEICVCMVLGREKKNRLGRVPRASSCFLLALKCLNSLGAKCPQKGACTSISQEQKSHEWPWIAHVDQKNAYGESKYLTHWRFQMRVWYDRLPNSCGRAHNSRETAPRQIL